MQRDFNRLFHAIVNDPIIDKMIYHIPKGATKYPQRFNHYSENVQATIRERARSKYNWNSK